MFELHLGPEARQSKRRNVATTILKDVKGMGETMGQTHFILVIAFGLAP